MWFSPSRRPRWATQYNYAKGLAEFVVGMSDFWGWFRHLPWDGLAPTVNTRTLTVRSITQHPAPEPACLDVLHLASVDMDLWLPPPEGTKYLRRPEPLHHAGGGRLPHGDACRLILVAQWLDARPLKGRCRRHKVFAQKWPM